MKNLNHKTKNKLLLIGFAVFFIVCYQMAFDKTINEFNSYKKSSALLEDAQDNTEKVRLMKNQILKYGTFTAGKSISDSITFQQSLLSIISDNCKSNKITLTEFNEPKKTSENGFALETITFKVKGDFNKLINLVYLIEKKFKIGKVMAANYYSEQNYKTQKKELTACIYIQNFVKQNNVLNKENHE